MRSTVSTTSSGWSEMTKELAFIDDSLRAAAARLAAKGLMQPGDCLSQRIPERQTWIWLVLPANGTAEPTPVHWAASAAGQRPELHERLYAGRADVGAILESRPAWASRLGQLPEAMPALFDEQVRHLGLGVGQASERPGAPVPLDFYPGANALALADRVLCCGMGLERLLLNAELLEKCAKAFVLAQSSGRPLRRIPWLVRYIANRRLLRDEREAAACHGAGRRSVMQAGY